MKHSKDKELGYDVEWGPAVVVGAHVGGLAEAVGALYMRPYSELAY